MQYGLLVSLSETEFVLQVMIIVPYYTTETYIVHTGLGNMQSFICEAHATECHQWDTLGAT